MTSRDSSVTDRRFALGDLMDPQALTDLCSSYSDLYGIAIKIFDAENRKLVDTRRTLDLCRFIFDFHGTKVRCTGLVTEIKATDAETLGEELTVTCFTGLQYRLAPLNNDTEVLGKLIFGPFLPVDWAGTPTDLTRLDPAIDPAASAVHYQGLVRAKPEAIERILSQLMMVLDVMIHNGYRMRLTAETHIESITGAYKELNTQNVKLQDSYEKLKELDRLKSNFLATVSHELRTPLTSVIGYSEMLMEGLAGELNAEQLDYVKTIREKGEALLSLISSLLDLSRYEAGSLRLNRERFPVGPLIEEVMRTITPDAQRKGVRVHSDTSRSLPTLSGDREKVSQALLNLAHNAVKFTSKGGEVALIAEVRTEGRPDNPGDLAEDLFIPNERRVMQLRVRDTGIGIPMSELEKIFQSFYQVDSSSTREYGGTGLGLSIARNFIVAHGGRIEAHSDLGRGSSFTITLPVDG